MDGLGMSIIIRFTRATVDQDRYLGFLKESGQHYDISYVHVLKRNFEGYTSMLRREFLGMVHALHVHQSVYTRAAKYFKTERLRRVFTFASMYLGVSPQPCSALAVELTMLV
jgi:phytoene desaturase (3,4-didehydrolycopene-forming)